MRRLRLQIERIGPHFRTLLVQGEVGTGKGVVARTLHAYSRDADSRFTVCYGAALAESMHEGVAAEAGSAWQAIATAGRVTIFVDGVDELPPRAQSRLLELIDAWPRSHHQPRMIASTTLDLKRLLATGRFRADLYHRLTTVEISIDPLRDRRADIPCLAQYFLETFASVYEKRVLRIDEMAMERLLAHEWPGNVRELENAIRNAVLRCEDTVIGVEDLVRLSTNGPNTGPAGADRGARQVESLQQIVDRHVVRVLEVCGGNKVRAAEMLGVSRSTLYRMLDSLPPAVER